MARSAVDWVKSLSMLENYSVINSFQALLAIESGLAFVPALAVPGCPPLATERTLHLGGHVFGACEGVELVQPNLEGIDCRATKSSRR